MQHSLSINKTKMFELLHSMFQCDQLLRYYEASVIQKKNVLNIIQYDGFISLFKNYEKRAHVYSNVKFTGLG